MFVKAFSAIVFDVFGHWLILVTIMTFVRGKWRKFVGAVTMAYFVLLVYSPLPVFLLENLEGQYEVPAPELKLEDVVILGGDSMFYRKDLNQFLMNRSSDRIIEGIRLVKVGRAKRVIFSGGTPFEISKEALAESDAVQKLALEMGLNPDQVKIERESMSTSQSSANVARYLNRAGEKFFLVTSASHMNRAVKTFEKNNLKPVGYPVDFYALYAEGAWYNRFGLYNLNAWRIVLHEYLGYFYYLLRGYI